MITVTIKNLNGEYGIKCLSADIVSLPTDGTYKNGTEAYCMDNQTLFMFDEQNHIWIQQ